MVGRRQMADGGFHQGHGSKEETGAVDPSRDQRRRGSSRIAARRSRKTQATGSAACSNNTASAGYRTCADAHRDPDGSACRVGDRLHQLLRHSRKTTRPQQTKIGRL